MKYLPEVEEQFESIYRTYENDVYRLCLFLTKNHDVAQDLAQQTFINFYNHFEKVEMEKAFAYLTSIARNLHNNYERDAKRGLQIESLSDEADQKLLATKSLEEEYFRREHKEKEKEFIDVILKRMRGRSSNWYDIFERIYNTNQSYEEISDELGVAREVLYSRVYRARRYAQKHYEKKLEEITELG